MRPEKDTENPPGQIVNPIPEAFKHPILGSMHGGVPYPSHLVPQAAIEDARPLVERLEKM